MGSLNYTYMLYCADNSLYSGWTNDLTHRLTVHNYGKNGAKYTRVRRPVTLAYCEVFATQGEAMTREAELKALSRTEKHALIEQMHSPVGEKLTIYDSNMNPAGVFPRTVVHQCGLRHRVIHVLVREQRGDQNGVWLQQRDPSRPVLPGYFDWTATGHVDAGEELRIAAARELCEESGLVVPPDDLQLAGDFHYRTTRAVGFEDDEIASAFLYHSSSTPDFAIGPEVARMAWASDRALSRAFTHGDDCTIVLQDGTIELIPAGMLSTSPHEWQKVRAL